MRKVLIIGAGPAGLTAGYELLKHTGQYDVTILEEAPQVGGISKTIQYKNHRMDLGGHCFRTENERIRKWWEEILPLQGKPALDDSKCGRKIPLAEGGPDPELTDDVLLVRNRVAHVLYQDKFFDYPIRMSMNTLRNMGIGSSIKAGFDFVGNSVSRKREVNLEHYYLNRFGKQLYKVFFEDYIEKLWGKHPSKIELDVGIQYIKGQSVATVIRENDKNIDNPQFFYPKLGAGQMWERVAHKIEDMGGIIHTNCTVLKANKVNSKIKSLTCVMDGEPIEVETDIVISTMPIKDLVIGMTDAPANVLNIAKHLCYRDMVTVNLLLPKLNINVDASDKTLGNIIPDTWIYIQDKRRKLARVQICNNWSPYLLKDPENTVWVTCEFYCEEGDEYWNKSESEWIRFAKQEMSFLHLISGDTPVFESHKECVKKAYPSYFGGYADIDEVIKYLNSIPNLYCIGRNGQHKCHDMSYAMLTAFAAVKNIVYHVDSRENVWNVKQSDAETPAPTTNAKSYQTAAPVPPKANAYVPPTPVKTPSKPAAVPSAPVIHVSDQSKKVTKEVLRDVVEQDSMSDRPIKEPAKTVSFKTVDKMFASGDAVETEVVIPKVKDWGEQKVTQVKELKPALVVQEADDAIKDQVVELKNNSKGSEEPVSFKIREPEIDTEVPLKESMNLEENAELQIEPAETEEAEETDETSKELHPLMRNMLPADEVMQHQIVKKVKHSTPIPLAKDIERPDSISVSPSVVTAESAQRTSSRKEPVQRGEMEAVRQFEKVISLDVDKTDDAIEEARRKEEEAERARIEEARRKAEEAERARIEEARRKAEEEERVRIEEVRRKAEEEERARIAEEKRKAQEEALARIAEEKRKAEEAERARIAEEKRKAEEAERARIAEEKRKAKEAERARIAQEKEAERARIAEEKRKAKEAERERIAQEKEAERARIAEEKRKAKEAERERIAQEKEAERARIAEEKRKAKEAERERIAQEKEAERERIAQEKEAERVRMADEKRKKKEEEKTLIAEEKRKAKETEKERAGQEKNKEKELSGQKRKTEDQRNSKKVVKEEATNNPIGQTATVGKITGRIIKTNIVEIAPEEFTKRKRDVRR